MASRGSQTEPDLDLDDWFAETEFAPRRPRRPVAREDEALADFDVEQAADDWLARNAGGAPAAPGPGGLNLSSFSSPALWLAVAAVVVLVVAGLFVGGVFSSSKKHAPTVSTPVVNTPTTTTPAAKTPKTSKTPKVTLPTQALKPGDSGVQVKRLQQALAAVGYKSGKADGRFGPATKTALEKFQKAKKLTVDGVLGPKTLSALQLASH